MAAAAISGALTGIGGAIYAQYVGYIDPDSVLHGQLSILIPLPAVLGGVGTLWGPLVGVVPFTVVMDFISGHFPNQTAVIIGLAFLAIVYVLPDGVTGQLETLFHRRRSLDKSPLATTAEEGR